MGTLRRALVGLGRDGMVFLLAALIAGGAAGLLGAEAQRWDDMNGFLGAWLSLILIASIPAVVAFALRRQRLAAEAAAPHPIIRVASAVGFPIGPTLVEVDGEQVVAAIQE